MSRILLLIPLILWMSWPAPATEGELVRPLWASVGLFLGGFAAIVLVLGAWARVILRRAGTRDFYRRTSRFNRGIFFARMLVPAWLGVGLTVLGWRAFVGRTLGFDSIDFPLIGLLIGTAPCYLAWMGLWWSQYPTERAMREQSVLASFDRDLPVHEPPGFGAYFATHFRLQILFTLVPVVLVLATVDSLEVALRPLGRWIGYEAAGHVHQALVLVAVAVIYILSPEILRRVLPTRPLDNSPLRQRLQRLAARQNLKVRDILLWETHHNICNAAVMGIFGRFRYVLLTDLLIETMTDEQIEAVFAHEVGHVVHRHMQWYVLVIATLVFLLSGFEQLIIRQWPTFARETWLGLSAELWFTLAAATGFILAFGFLSRRFERQADVFAARSMQREQATGGGEVGSLQLAVGSESELATGNWQLATPVGPYGAGVFTSALHRVASVNNIPLTPRRWAGGGAGEMASFAVDRSIEWATHFLHGSISRRTTYLQRLGTDPVRTTRYDTLMRRLYTGLLVLFALSIAFAFHPQLLALWERTNA